MPQKVLLAFLSLLLVWIMLTGLNKEEIMFGVAACGLIALISSRELIKLSLAPKLNPRRWLFFLVFAAVFLMEEVHSHLDVTQRIFLGGAETEIFTLDTKIKNPAALTFLGNAITLTPGTTTLDVKDRSLLIYSLDVQSERTTERFEGVWERIFI